MCRVKYLNEWSAVLNLWRGLERAVPAAALPDPTTPGTLRPWVPLECGGRRAGKKNFSAVPDSQTSAGCARAPAWCNGPHWPPTSCPPPGPPPAGSGARRGSGSPAAPAGPSWGDRTGSAPPRRWCLARWLPFVRAACGMGRPSCHCCRQTLLIWPRRSGTRARGTERRWAAKPAGP